MDISTDINVLFKCTKICFHPSFYQTVYVYSLVWTYVGHIFDATVRCHKAAGRPPWPELKLWLWVLPININLTRIKFGRAKDTSPPIKLTGSNLLSGKRKLTPDSKKITVAMRQERFTQNQIASVTGKKSEYSFQVCEKT